MTLRGSCLCGEVAYEVDALASEIRHCSCNVCRKAHAAAFNTSAGVEVAHFRWLRGEGLLQSYESSPGKRRRFCSRCGSQLVAQRDGSDKVILRVATLDEDPGPRPTGHIWMSDAVPWLDDGADLPRFERWADPAA